ncbi:MAG: GspH/FimT family pseudopilin [Acidobacteriota bacterium]|nr:GspH/FimT family pseudopilin [Acidobacteriota bacterium]
MSDDFFDRKKRKQHGFSLIELIIVVLVIAIMLTASFPAIRRSLQLYRLESAAGLVTSRLTEARMVAVKRNRRASVALNTGSNTLEIRSLDDNGQSVVIGSAVSLPQDVVLQISPGGGDSISFSSLGRNLSNDTANITLTLGAAQAGYCKTVTVSPVGKITASGCSRQ